MASSFENHNSKEGWPGVVVVVAKQSQEQEQLMVSSFKNYITKEGWPDVVVVKQSQQQQQLMGDGVIFWEL